MASRRLQSDRFLTVDFRPEIYSPFGMDWIAQNGMTSLILRHCPELARVAAARRQRLRAVAAGRSGLQETAAMSTEADHRARPGLDALPGRPLLETIWKRRTHRVSRGSDDHGRLA